jgi:hypothetical protein
LNSDDVYFDGDVVASSVTALQAHPDVDVVHGEVALISEDSGLQMIWCMPQFNYERALRGYIIPQPTVFFRRSVTEKHRLDPTLKVAIDHIYWLQIGREHKFLKLHRIQAGDRDHKGRISQVSNVTLMETGRKACAAYGAKEPGLAARLLDYLWKAALRMRGLLYMLRLMTRPGLANELAFPVWIDSLPKAMRRQLTMRIGKRSDMGRRPWPAGESHVAE